MGIRQNKKVKGSVCDNLKYMLQKRFADNVLVKQCSAINFTAF